MYEHIVLSAYTTIINNVSKQTKGDIMEEIMIPGVTNISTVGMERAFRRNKTMSREIRKGSRCKIEKMRTILKNWFNPESIPDSEMNKKNKSRYRGLVYSYLKDKNTNKCPEPYKALIEEYIPYITDENLIKQYKEKESMLKRDIALGGIDTNLLNKNIHICKLFSNQLKQLGAKEFKVKFEESELCINIF